jgi:hypothetical protein
VGFQLIAITKRGAQWKIFFIPLHQRLQDNLDLEWSDQYREFMKEIREVDYDPAYETNSDERYRLEEFVLPEWLHGVTSETCISEDHIDTDENTLKSIKGLAGLGQNDNDQRIILFQSIRPSRIIRPRNSLFLSRNTCDYPDRPGIILDSQVSAVYFEKDRKLLFRNFRTANSFLPLEIFFSEASEKEIRQLLKHEKLCPQDIEQTLKDSDQWFKKRFAMLRNSRVLDVFSIDQIVETAKEHRLDLELDNNRIVFPSEKFRARRLLQFLNEEVFRGPITDTLFETNSKRKTD